EQLVLADALIEPVVDRLDADLLRRLVLASDVESRRRVVADEHRGQADRAEPAHLLGHLGSHARRERATIHERRHEPRNASLWARWRPSSSAGRPRLPTTRTRSPACCGSMS